jgi:hypothetical protein
MLDIYDEVFQAVSQAGFTVLGAFHPNPADGAPSKTKTLVLVGNVGPEMWARFARERDTGHSEMDDWTQVVVTDLAKALDAEALFPFDVPPLPFQRWARAAQAAFASPIGLNIHPDYGLWHAFRAALCFRGKLDVPSPSKLANPCDTCAGRPCLSTCPVSAFDGSSYDTSACSGYLSSLAGKECVSGGCQARLACPVGREFLYKSDQMQFHMQAFLKARLLEKSQI